MPVAVWRGASSESDVGGACSFRVSDRGDDVRDTLCLKLQNKYYGPLIEWFEEVRVLLTHSVTCMLTWLASPRQRFDGPLEVVDGLDVPHHGASVIDNVLTEVRKVRFCAVRVSLAGSC